MVKFCLITILLFILYPFNNSFFNEYECQCAPIEFTADVSHEIFKSNGFPKHYCNNQKCSFEIEAKENSVVVLNIEHFDIEPTHDFVEVYQTQIYNGSRIKVKGHILTGSGYAAHQIKSSIGGGLLVLFVTDSTENSYSGFRMSFSRVDQTEQFNDGCPLPFVYVNNLDVKEIILPRAKFTMETTCVYQFNSSKFIELDIKHLSLGMDVRVYETENFDSKNPDRSKLITYSYFTLSQLNSTKVIHSRTHSLTLIVKIVGRRNEITKEDIYITYKEIEDPCSCPPNEIMLQKGVKMWYSSPGYPENYCDNLNCITKFTTSEQNDDDKQFVFTFNAFEMERDLDYISFGFDNISLVKISDPNKGVGLRRFAIKRHDPVLRVVSDHSITLGGFNFTVEALKEGDTCECFNRKQLENLNSVMGDITFTIDKNCKFVDCFINITQEEFKEKHKVSFAITSNMGDGEFIEIGPGENTMQNPDIYHLKGFSNAQKTSNEYFFENAQNILIWYHRERPLLPSEVTLKIQYDFNVLCACPPSQLSAKEGEWETLTSPDYPQHYCNDLTCRHLITAPYGYRVIVNVTNVSTEVNHDKVVFFDGDSINTTHIELLSGIVIMSDLIKSKESQMTIYFESDTSISGKGYSLLYSAEKMYDSNRYNGKISGYKIILWIILFITIAIIFTFTFSYYKKGAFTTPFNYQNLYRSGSLLRFRNINHPSENSNML
uniref:CUB domain-containing protein n=1 Tax=Parastrongyloides trichosuri TaxID=131310 RepID=A0A0N4ZR86_PARTI